MTDDMVSLIQNVSNGEDRSDFIRASALLLVAVRNTGVLETLSAHLMANETLENFCANAVHRAVLHRISLKEQEKGALLDLN
ncbi:MAG: hypothetical protein PHI71_04605 [Acidiphilium sp.]|nr:hypothetical protein [Acidiphilium sp.]